MPFPLALFNMDFPPEIETGPIPDHIIDPEMRACLGEINKYSAEIKFAKDFARTCRQEYQEYIIQHKNLSHLLDPDQLTENESLLESKKRKALYAQTYSSSTNLHSGTYLQRAIERLQRLENRAATAAAFSQQQAMDTTASNTNNGQRGGQEVKK
ncbi:Protein CBG27792 [Caenorhabditis briggsae]|uniref:Uncharacterized protein n=2 Tax=Caenorhabditis briggsae TaxID=6238 RepID=A0AAE9JSM5_CAEBR|nr:Protein CBG27792 [Caenorhabditis briggsae]ULT83059.1 hypothetical protein L3Y34_012354 [Caenorhabditis briggsae]UMM42356.1 hypothetical protein L5515_018211 [Caenorhabditis briggsae]CAR99559.1 Protein CBG27792 [Caenorhabditis briggsae]